MHACLSSSSPLGQSMKPSQRTWSSIQRYRPVRSGVGHANLSMPSSSAGGHSVTHDVTLIFCEIRFTQLAVYMEANADGHTAVPPRAVRRSDTLSMPSPDTVHATCFIKPKFFRIRSFHW